MQKKERAHWSLPAVWIQDSLPFLCKHPCGFRLRTLFNQSAINFVSKSPTWKPLRALESDRRLITAIFYLSHAIGPRRTVGPRFSCILLSGSSKMRPSSVGFPRGAHWDCRLFHRFYRPMKDGRMELVAFLCFVMTKGIKPKFSWSCMLRDSNMKQIRRPHKLKGADAI